MGYYCEISRGYDALHFEEQAEKARIIMANCSRLRGLLLDIGAGTGKATSLFSAENLRNAEAFLTVSEPKGFRKSLGKIASQSLFHDKVECVALDPSKEMLCSYAGLKVVARAEQLPFKAGRFDCIVSITALHHACLSKAVPEIFRVAKPNACIAISFFKRVKNFAAAKKLLSAFRQIDSEKDLIFIKQ